uniref:Uncharacterized protein n=1 Tax=Rhizophora mucronata TaxID=61149 RepID=A0A2P2P6J1_RHIMU
MGVKKLAKGSKTKKKMQTPSK